jgi:non-heme chloroperoxidase
MPTILAIRDILRSFGDADYFGKGGIYMANRGIESKYVRTSDGANLHYLEAGTGPVLLMLHSWSGTAEQFHPQIAGLGERNRCIALEMRGHGDSEKVDHGYKIQRLAKDVYDVLQALELTDVVLLGHSMGCSLIWCYWDLFGPQRLRKLILVDEAPFLTSNPAWSDAERRLSGAIWDLQAALSTCNAIAGPDGESTTKQLFDGCFTKTMPNTEKTRLIESFLKLPRQYAASLLYNHCAQDWRDVIPRISLPTLIVGGRASIFPWQSQAWIHQQISGSRLEIFEEEQGGNHFMFIEQPQKFNRIVSEFIGHRDAFAA